MMQSLDSMNRDEIADVLVYAANCLQKHEKLQMELKKIKNMYRPTEGGYKELWHGIKPVTNRLEGTFRSLRYAFGGDHPSQTTHQSVSSHPRVRTQTNEGSYFNNGSTNTGVPASKPPTYPTHHVPKFNDKL